MSEAPVGELPFPRTELALDAIRMTTSPSWHDYDGYSPQLARPLAP